MKKIDWNKKNIILSKKLTVFGSLLLILSFVVQNFFFNKWDDKLNAFEQANRDYSEMTRSSLEYQNLYLSLDSQSDSVKKVLKPAFIKAAAEKYRVGKMVSTNLDLLENESEANKFVENTNELLMLINQVNDMPTLYNFVKEVEVKLPENKNLKTQWLNKMNNKKENASYIFAILQITGSIMIAIGFRYQ